MNLKRDGVQNKHLNTHFLKHEGIRLSMAKNENVNYQIEIFGNNILKKDLQRKINPLVPNPN